LPNDRQSMSAATILFETIYSGMPDARCKLRIGRAVVARAISAGLTVHREDTDLGQVGGIEGNVRLLAADEPDGEIQNGTPIEVLPDGADEKTGWLKARVGGRYSVAGLTRLILEAVNE